ncbi:BZ3500_MvSof-1268-A1-R1_Chr3-3g06507 [Microbotryum saponariae]|uniref:BZ3500_MvSof-1268-A1-R1_Chr3-3g06507 protein n=1 Tax=Microbotryum saponariae TaxID=289078 RepID=A0A2X0N084_9BASI|nr:BZ3500_MvSof-1268-A1-R1_Chr3-3g06507 [Microbotryum saponariae]SDA04474.1 BZ3501_MvSof-1269-A2-R1_Chr3-2g06194 [Microbotryum saponariae]
MVSKLLGALDLFFALSRAHADPPDVRRLTTGPSSKDESETEPSRSSSSVCFDGRGRVTPSSSGSEVFAGAKRGLALGAVILGTSQSILLGKISAF